MANDVAADPFVDPLAASESTIVGDEMDAVACSRGVVLRLGTEGLVVVGMEAETNAPGQSFTELYSIDESYTEQSSWLCGLLPESNPAHQQTRAYPQPLTVPARKHSHSFDTVLSHPERRHGKQWQFYHYPLRATQALYRLPSHKPFLPSRKARR